MSAHPVITGILYGLFVWMIMNWVVIPLVFSAPWQYNGFKTWKAILILIIIIGLPLSFIMKKYVSGISTKKS